MLSSFVCALLVPYQNCVLQNFEVLSLPSDQPPTPFPEPGPYTIPLYKFESKRLLNGHFDQVGIKALNCSIENRPHSQLIMKLIKDGESVAYIPENANCIIDQLTTIETNTGSHSFTLIGARNSKLLLTGEGRFAIASSDVTFGDLVIDHDPTSQYCVAYLDSNKTSVIERIRFKSLVVRNSRCFLHDTREGVFGSGDGKTGVNEVYVESIRFEDLRGPAIWLRSAFAYLFMSDLQFSMHESFNGAALTIGANAGSVIDGVTVVGSPTTRKEDNSATRALIRILGSEAIWISNLRAENFDGALVKTESYFYKGDEGHGRLGTRFLFLRNLISNGSVGSGIRLNDTSFVQIDNVRISSLGPALEMTKTADFGYSPHSLQILDSDFQSARGSAAIFSSVDEIESRGSRFQGGHGAGSVFTESVPNPRIIAIDSTPNYSSSPRSLTYDPPWRWLSQGRWRRIDPCSHGDPSKSFEKSAEGSDHVYVPLPNDSCRMDAPLSITGGKSILSLSKVRVFFPSSGGLRIGPGGGRVAGLVWTRTDSNTEERPAILVDAGSSASPSRVVLENLRFEGGMRQAVRVLAGTYPISLMASDLAAYHTTGIAFDFDHVNSGALRRISVSFKGDVTGLSPQSAIRLNRFTNSVLQEVYTQSGGKLGFNFAGIEISDSSDLTALRLSPENADGTGLRVLNSQRISFFELAAPLNVENQLHLVDSNLISFRNAHFRPSAQNGVPERGVLVERSTQIDFVNSQYRAFKASPLTSNNSTVSRFMDLIRASAD